MNGNIKILCKLLGGSHLYGLNTPSSDLDHRGIFKNCESSYILGTHRFDESRKQNNHIKQDEIYKELSHWVRMLAQANTEALEILFAPPEFFSEYESEMDLFRFRPFSFVDSKKLFNALRGYAQSEYRLAIGERRGKIGSLRSEAIEKYGFSPKNCVQLLRLLWVGTRLFSENRFIVNCREFGKEQFDYLYNIKTKPETYNTEQFGKDYKESEGRLVSAYENRQKTYHFDEKLANSLLLSCYFPALSHEFINGAPIR